MQDPNTTADMRLNALLSGSIGNRDSNALSVATIETEATRVKPYTPSHQSMAVTVISTNTEDQLAAREKYERDYGHDVIGAKPMSAKNAQELEATTRQQRKELFNNERKRRGVEHEIANSKKKIRFLTCLLILLGMAATLFLILAFMNK